jgi:hypothetical protein
MRLAGLELTADAVAGFAGRYGLLREREPEALADWYEAIEVLARIAAPWGQPRDHECHEMPAPTPAANPALREAHYHARTFGERAFGRDLHPAIGEAGATFEPRTLLGFLFLDALADKQALPVFRRCAYPACQGWFAVGGRVDQKYCLGKHRSLHHYHERKR